MFLMEESNEDVKNGSWKILKNSVMQVLIDREFFSTNWMYFSIDWIGFENQSSEEEAKWWISSFFDRSSKRFDWLKAMNFEFWIVFD